MTWQLISKKPAPKHSDVFLSSSGKGVRYDHRLCDRFDDGAESRPEASRLKRAGCEKFSPRRQGATAKTQCSNLWVRGA